MAANPFELPQGGLDNIEATIGNPSFVIHDEFTDSQGDPLVVLRIELDPADGENEPWHRDYAVGPGWEPADGGARIVRADDPDADANVNGSTRLGRLINKIVALCPEVIKERYNDGDGLGSTDAAMFDGLRFHWANEMTPKRVRNEDGSWTTSATEQNALLLPDDFIEVVGGTKAKKAPAKAPAKKKAAAKKPAPKDDGLPDDLLASAREAYDAAEGFDDWLEAMLSVDGADEHLDFISQDTDGLWDQLVAEHQ